MVALIFDTCRGVVALIAGRNGPRELAAGLILGMILGLLPKDNLLAAAIGVLVLATHAHLLVATLATLVFSCLAPTTDLVALPIGEWLLTHDDLRPLWTWLSGVPMLYWTGFNETSVLGNLVLSGLLAMPVWLLAEQVLLARSASAPTNQADSQPAEPTALVDPEPSRRIAA